MSEALLALKGVCISFPSVDAQTVCAVQDLDLSISSGEFVALVGMSGCGKSTVLNAMAGLLTPQAGSVHLHGKPLSGIPKEIGYIAQADHLLPWRSVLENVALGLQLRSRGKAERREIAFSWLARMDLLPFAQHYPHELSGGMKKRVSIARTLALEPEILLMDEPFAPLDAFTREKLQSDILQVWEGTGQTVIYVTHDLQEAVALSDRVLLMAGRPGRVLQSYPINLARPRDLRALRFDEAFLHQEKTIWDALLQEEGETR